MIERKPFYCRTCGEELQMHYSADGMSGVSSSHHCNGIGVETIRRILREELTLALLPVKRSESDRKDE